MKRKLLSRLLRLILCLSISFSVVVAASRDTSCSSVLEETRIVQVRLLDYSNSFSDF